MDKIIIGNNANNVLNTMYIVNIIISILILLINNNKYINQKIRIPQLFQYISDTDSDIE